MILPKWGNQIAISLSITVIRGALYLLSFTPAQIRKKIEAYASDRIHKRAKKKGICQKNLRICMPHLNEIEIDALIEKNAKHLAGILFSWVKALSWTDHHLRAKFPYRIDGLDNLSKKGDRGVLLLMKHSTQFFIESRVIGLHQKTAAVAGGPTRHGQLFERFYIALVGLANKKGVVSTQNMIKSLRWLKSGEVLLYYPDHDYGAGSSETINFCGAPAATIIAPYKIQRSTNCRICITQSFFDKDGVLNLTIRELTNLDRSNQKKFLEQMNNEISADIFEHPHEYLWRYKRFKSMGLYDK